MIGWLAETAVAVTALMLLVLALRRPVARLFGAGWAYALWAIPALRLVLPPLPSLTPEIAFPAAVSFIPTAVGGTAPLPAEAGPGQWLPIMLVMWAGGALLFLLHQRRAYLSFVERLDADSCPGTPSNYGSIRLLVSGAVDGPLALGLLDRRIVLPVDFTHRYTGSERRLALAHELTHHRRGDLWWSLAAMLVLALNWFNPVAWVAFRAFRADQELACDAAVAAGASAEERCDYAKALVKSASRPGLIAACAFNSTAQLKRRLKMMRSHRAGILRRAGGLVTVFAAGAASLAFAAPQAPLDRPVVEPVLSLAPAGAVPLPEPAAESVVAPPAAAVPGRRAADKPRPRRRSPARAVPAAADSAPVEDTAPAAKTIPVEIAAAPVRAPQFVVFTRVTTTTARSTRPTEAEIAALLARVRAAHAAESAPPIIFISEAKTALRRLRLTPEAPIQGE